MLTKSATFAAGAALIIAVSAFATQSNAQGSGKAKTTTQGTKPTLGTVQMAGDNGKLGTVYQLGAKGKELHFTLDSAAFAMRFKTKDSNIIAGKNERLLVLNFTVHNPLKVEQEVNSSSFKFTVVSPDDKNIDSSGAFFEPVKLTSISQLLKPAQKVKLVAVMAIYPGGPVPKLIVTRGAPPVLRYDLREKIGPLTSVFTEDGVSVGDEAKVELKKPFDLAGFDMEIQEVTKATEAIGSYNPDSYTVYYAVVKFSNPLLKPLSVGWQYFTPQLTDENGENIQWPKDLYSMSSTSAFSQDVEGDGSVRARYMFYGPKGLTAAKLKLTHNSSGRSVSVKLQ